MMGTTEDIDVLFNFNAVDPRDPNHLEKAVEVLARVVMAAVYNEVAVLTIPNPYKRSEGYAEIHNAEAQNPLE